MDKLGDVNCYIIKLKLKFMLSLKLTFRKQVALHWATLKGDDTSSSAITPIQVTIAYNKEKLYNNILAHIFFGNPCPAKAMLRQSSFIIT